MAKRRVLRVRGGHRFEIITAGTGRRTLVVHPGGPGLTSEYLANLLELSGPDRRVVLLHPRGVGRSYAPRSARAYTLSALVEDLEAVRQALGGAPIDLLGFSAGGFVAIEYALNHPEALRLLVLSGTAASAADLRLANARMLRKATAAQRAALRSFDRTRRYTSPEYQSLIEEVERPFQTGHLPAPPPELVASRLNPRVYRAMMTRTGNEFVVDGTLAKWDARPRLSQIRTPTLVLVGVDDFLAPATRVIARKIRGSQLVELPRASHLANLERPKAYLTVVRRFLGSRSGRPPRRDRPLK